ncbi:protein-disulfide isomerase [Pseudoalteromonas sp. GCY]|uniref:DsbA family protein n=1 Tax=Pseudoalteromonas sp. GCY TaxID=2003316 RepID=UPI000BFEEDC0|nr:DsbA family protein [Pseudoalteromonas sp. GCY]PHI34658.1 protein-disulfide isomerase [Pseudoalteromonas sp. GCY]QQQ66033.1 DsbA family protein [Pseudoalteromonas sp. GCY]
MVKVHYFFDPMCGWCYGATSLLDAIAANSDLKLELHPGGMIANQSIEKAFRSHILTSDARIASITGSQFGKGYIQRVKSNDPMILDSYITARAIITAEQLGIAPLNMLKTIQHAHYVEGKQVNRTEVIEGLAVELGLDKNHWQRAMLANQGTEQTNIAQSRLLMQKLQVTGYPTLILEKHETSVKLPHTAYYGKPDAWRQLIDDYIH